MCKEGDQPIRSMRVLVSGHLPPPMGGVGAFYQALLNSSLPQRLDLSFVVTSSQQRSLSTSGRATLPNLLSAVGDCVRFAKAVRKQHPTVTHIATAFGLSFIKHSICVVIARLAGSRVLLHPHCNLNILYTERSMWWKWYFRQVIRLTVGVIALSSEWEQLRDILPDCRVYSLPNAIDLSPLRPLALERFRDGRKQEPLTVFYIGCLGKAKGTFDLIHAAARVRANVVFALVGEESDLGAREQLQALVNTLQLEERFTLHPPAFGDEKLAFFRQADIFVYPSYHEGMPLAVLEAMACGLPIVATRVGGLPDLVQDGLNGLLVGAGNPDQLADAISRIANDGEMRSSMQQKAYQLVSEHFDMEHLVLKLVDIYNTAAAGV